MKITKILSAAMAMFTIAAAMSVSAFADDTTIDPTGADPMAITAEATSEGTVEATEAMPISAENPEDIVLGMGEDPEAGDIGTDTVGTSTEAEGTTTLGDSTEATDDKGSPDTGVEGMAAVAGVAVVAGGVMLLACKKRS